VEPCGFDGHDTISAVFAGGPSPRTEVVHAVVNQHNPPGYPHGPMAAQGFPYSCAASSFCGGALRVGDFKLLVGYPGWDDHYAYPNGSSFSPDTQLHWAVCETHCLFDVGADIAELHDLSADPVHAPTLARMLARFWALSNASGARLADSMFDNEQCASARSEGFWRPLDYDGPVPPDPLPQPPPPPPPANHSGHWVTKPGRGGCGEPTHALPGKHLSTLKAVELHCDEQAACAFFIWNQKGLSGSKAGAAYFCTVDKYNQTKPDAGWLVGHRVAS
jgi:hypothetical protein